MAYKKEVREAGLAMMRTGSTLRQAAKALSVPHTTIQRWCQHYGVKIAGGAQEPKPRPPIRKRLSNRLRFQVLERDGFTCRYCGSKAPEVKLVIDHIVPVARGGVDHVDNLVTACQECNSGKFYHHLRTVPPNCQMPSQMTLTGEGIRHGAHT